MNPPRLIRWAVVGCAALAITAGFVLSRRSGNPELPAVSRHEKLPEAFNQVLQSTHRKASAQPTDPEEVRKLARLYQANRLFPEARACFQVIAAKSSGLTARDHYYLADLAANQGDLDSAQAELRATLKTEPRYLPAQLALAEALFKSGREEDAAKEYSAILASEAGQPQASLGLARIELQRGEDEAAVARLEDLTASHPASTGGAALFAQILERRGEADRAVAMTQLSVQKPEPPPADPWADALLADCYDVQRLSITFEEYFKAGKMTEAAPLLDRLAVLDPQGPITMMFSGFSHARALEHITAIREYYAALAKGGDPEKVCPSLVQSLLALGKGSEAMGLMADYYRKMPGSIPLAMAYSDVAIQQGDEKLARELLEVVLQKQPALLAQNMSLAKILWTAGERDTAVKCLQRVAALYANDVPSRALLGEYYLDKSDPVAAITPLKEAIGQAVARTPARVRLTTLLATAYLQAGNAAAENGHFAAAADYADQAILLAPADLKGYAGKAEACVQLKQFRRAAEALQKMVSLQPDNPTIYLSLGDVQYQDGETAQAQRQWQKARQLVAAGDADLIAALDLRLSGQITAETFK